MKKIYIIGIEGAGTSALAQIYIAQGHTVMGSDDGDGFYKKSLEKAGIKVYHSFDTAHIKDDIDYVVHSTAFNESNIEIEAVKEKKIKLQSYPEAIGDLAENLFTIAVCGTHGKTTTSGMLAHAMIGAGRDVNALIGAPVVGWKSGARTGTGKEFILEADEYQNKLAFYRPQSAILTSIDYDHPDFFPDSASYEKVFTDFVQRIPATGFLVVHHDVWKKIKDILQVRAHVFTYGEQSDADLTIIEREVQEEKQNIIYTFKEERKTLTVHLPGKHNALNAVAATLMSTLITGKEEESIKGLVKYRGTKRRFEHKGFYNSAVLIDDYAHHPEEVRLTLAAAKELYPDKNIITAFHPHTYSRTKALLEEFGRALDVADNVIILDIYGSAREIQGGVDATDLVKAVNQGISKKAKHIATIDKLAQWAKKNLTQSDVFLTLGAGDVYKVHEKIR